VDLRRATGSEKDMVKVKVTSKVTARHEGKVTRQDIKKGI
jgi:hypothetical protein